MRDPELCYLSRKLQVLCIEMARNPNTPYSEENGRTAKSMEESWKCQFRLIMTSLLLVCRFMMMQDLPDPCIGTFEGYFPNRMLSD